MTSRWGLAGLVVVIAALGPLVGFLWWAVSPVVPGEFAQGAIYPRETEPRGYITTDVYFAFGTIFVGLLVAWLVRRRWTGSPVVAVMGLTLGGIAGAALAVLVAYAFAPPATPKVLNGIFVDTPIRLGASGLLLVWPIASVGLWFFMDLMEWRPEQPTPA